MSIFEFAAWIDRDLSVGGFELMQLERLRMSIFGARRLKPFDRPERG
jgi:hypothetical protein